jgi:hypothetical protein
MKKNLFQTVLLSFASVILASSAIASDPCDPTVQARPSYMQCSDAGLQYSIKIQTLMSSPPPACPMSKHVEIHTATIAIRDSSERSVGTIVIQNDFFTYDTALPGLAEGTFTSPALSIDLRNCISPAHGGISAGN